MHLPRRLRRSSGCPSPRAVPATCAHRRRGLIECRRSAREPAKVPGTPEHDRQSHRPQRVVRTARSGFERRVIRSTRCCRSHNNAHCGDHVSSPRQRPMRRPQLSGACCTSASASRCRLRYSWVRACPSLKAVRAPLAMRTASEPGEILLVRSRIALPSRRPCSSISTNAISIAK